ncbi:MAG TPA: PAS domain S-box protein [Candidatus Paceibacterota bacterium]|nr:PAS domain S-box protein [Candidatus Paceibacterota bacterium]
MVGVGKTIARRVFAGCLLSWLITVPPGHARAAAIETIASFQQFYALSTDQARAGAPVKLQAVLLCYDAGWNQIYLQDGTGAHYISPQQFRSLPDPPPEIGSLVEINGTTTVFDNLPSFTNLHLTLVRRGTVPPAKRLELANLAGDFGQWIEINGHVRVTDTSMGRLKLMIRDKNHSTGVYVLGPMLTNDYRHLLDCRIRVRGINATKAANGKIESAMVFAPQFDQITVLEKPAADFKSLRVLPIGDLLAYEPGDWTNQRVRINGLITAYQPGRSVTIQDPTGTLRAQVIQQNPIPVGTRVDAQGFLTVSPGERFLGDAWFQPLPRLPQGDGARSLPKSVPQAAAAGTLTNVPGTLTNISSILRLDRAKAFLGIPVRVQGVVTYADPEWRNGFLQDAGGAVYFDLGQNEVRSGHWVELTGVTGPGGFAPEVLNTSVRILGTTNLPTAAKVGLDDLAAGRLDAHWIEVEGVVREVSGEWGHVTLNVMSSRGRFKALVPGLLDKPLPMHLIDARVSITGACTSELNARRQLTGILLNVPSLDLIRVLDPAPEDPFSIETTRIDAVATFDPGYVAGRRVKVSGAVTLKIPGQGFVLQDVTGGIRVYSQQTNKVELGDAVDVIGFPALGEFSPVLEESRFRITGTGIPPAPLRTTAEQLLREGTNDSRVVEMTARLLQGLPGSHNPQLVLQDGPIIFIARLDSSMTGQVMPVLKSGSLLRVMGVCSIQGDPQRRPAALRLALRQPADLVVLEMPSWWTPLHTLLLAGSLTLVILAALTWIALLRRQVQAQTEVIRGQLEEEVALETRYRELFENANDLLFTLDMDGVCTAVNREVEQFFHLDRQRIVGRNLAEFVVPDSRASTLQQIQRLKSGSALGRFEASANRGSGDVARLDFRVRAIEENGGRKGLQATARDITELKKIQAELLRASRLAGMAEIATGVLHNVGNVLNSVNVSATLVSDQMRQSKIQDLLQATVLLQEHSDNLESFLTQDPKGKILPSYLIHLAEHLGQEQAVLLRELDVLTRSIGHIKEIVAMQQSYAKASGVIEILPAAELMEEALQMHEASFHRHGVEVIREYRESPPVKVDKHKVLQILLNLLTNARQAMDENEPNTKKRLVLGVAPSAQDRVRLTVQDTGIGISPENLTQIFRHGFTTKRNGHGFGLHLGALAAREMGGTLNVASTGIGHGAQFALELPIANP